MTDRQKQLASTYLKAIGTSKNAISNEVWRRYAAARCLCVKILSKNDEKKETNGPGEKNEG